MLDIVIIIAPVLVLGVIGAALYSGKGSFLIAGYNTMSEAEKAKFDEKKLCRAMGIFLFVLDAILALTLWSGVTNHMTVFAVSMALFFAAVIVGMILVNKAAKKE